MALATKLHIIVALPLVVFYIYKNDKKAIINFLLLCFLTLFLFDFPYLFSESFINMVIFNAKSLLIFDSFYNIGNSKLLLPVAAIFSIYLHFFNQNKVNNDLLFFYFGILFSAILLLVYSGPAWYVWIVPFVCIYFISNTNQSKSFALYVLFSAAYLIFFIFFYRGDYVDLYIFGKASDIKINNKNLSDIFFTFLEVALLGVVYVFYKYGIKSNQVYRKKNLLIGIGGDSGAGKSTLLKNIKKLLGDERMLEIEGDGEHKWERDNSNWQIYTHLDPKANHLHSQTEALFALKNNKSILRKDYDHSSGKFTQAVKIYPKEFIVIAGLHPFYLPKLRQNIDLKIYLDTSEKIKNHWKIVRDVKTRGKSYESVLAQIKKRANDGKKYIHPQRDFADIVVRYFELKDFESGSQNAKLELGLELVFNANIRIENLLSSLDLEWDYNDDLKTQYIRASTPPILDFTKMAWENIENIDEILAPGAKFSSGYDGLVEFIILLNISEKLKEKGSDE